MDRLREELNWRKASIDKGAFLLMDDKGSEFDLFKKFYAIWRDTLVQF